MTINKKTICVIICGIVAVVLLVLIIKAMGPEQVGGNEPIGDPTYTAASNSDNNGSNANHLYQQYSENVTIDTDIPASLPDSADLIYAEAIRFDEQLLMSMFFNGEPLAERGESSDGCYVYLGLEDGTYIGIDVGSFKYRSESDFMHLKLATENFLTNSEHAYLPSFNKTYGEIYQCKELGFMSSESAVAEVKKILSPLPITLSECVELYALDHKTMQQYQDEYLQKYPDDEQNYTIKEVLTKEDDCYLICFQILQENIPMTQCSRTYLADYRTIEGSVVKVFYSAKGIINISVSGAYQAKSVSGQSEIFISAEQAIELAIKAKVIAGAGGNITVINSCFEYVGVPYSKTVGEVLLTPAWNITVKTASGICETVHINASTGDVIK